MIMVIAVRALKSDRSGLFAGISIDHTSTENLSRFRPKIFGDSLGIAEKCSDRSAIRTPDASVIVCVKNGFQQASIGCDVSRVYFCQPSGLILDAIIPQPARDGSRSAQQKIRLKFLNFIFFVVLTIVYPCMQKIDTHVVSLEIETVMSPVQSCAQCRVMKGNRNT